MAKQDYDIIRVGKFVLDMKTNTLIKEEVGFHLTPTETRLMALLMENVGQVVSRDNIVETVWRSKPTTSRSLDVHIRWLRQKVEDDPNIPEYILTRRSMGYELRV